MANVAESLDPVLQTFLAVTTQYVDEIEKATRAAATFALVNQDATEAVDRLQSAVDDFSATGYDAALITAADAAGKTAKATNDLAQSLAGAGPWASSLNRRLGNLAEKADVLTGSLLALDAELDRKRAALAGTAFDAAAVAAAMKVAAGSTDTTAAAANRGGAAFRFWGFAIRNWGSVIHWVLAGTAELLAVAIPAAIAAAAGAFVLYQGVVEGVVPHMRSLFTATEATSNIFHKTTGDVLGLGHAFQAAQDAANPVAYSLLGAYVNAARSHMVGLAGAGLQVSHVLDTFAAKVVADLQGGMGKTIDDLLSQMVPDLVKFGQIFGNLGHAILNFASDMPGLAEALLGIASAISRVIEIVSELPRPLVLAFMAFEEFNRWGGVVVGLLGRFGLATSKLTGSFIGPTRAIGVLSNLFKAIPMLTAAVISNIGSLITGFGRVGGAAGEAGMAVRNFGADMTDMIVSIPAGWAAFGAVVVGGLIALIIALNRVKTPAQQLTDSMQAMADKASNLQVLDVASANIAHLGDVIAGTSRKVQAGGARIAGGIQAANPALKTLNQGLTQQQQDMVNTVAGAQYLARTYHTSLLGAMALADQAGVKLAKGILGQGRAAVIARVQVANLAAGYRAMGQPLGAVGSDMTALAIQSGLANTKVSQLNQAWDQFMQNLTAGTSGFAGFEGSLANLGSGIAHVRNNLSEATGAMSLSTRQFARSLESFTGKGAQAWQNFNQVVGSTAPQLIDWLRTAGAEGAIRGKQFSQAILGMTAQLVPFASKSATAKAEVLGLVQSAGLGIHTWPQLTHAIRDGHLSMSQLAKIIGDTTQKMANMSQVAKNLGTVLSSDLTQMVDQARIHASGLSDALNALSGDMVHGGIRAAGYKGDLDSVIRDMVSLHQTIPTITAVLNSMGVKITDAGVKAIIAAGHMHAMGGSAQSAGGQMNAAARAAQQLARWIASLHSKSIDINTTFTNTYVQGQGGTRHHRPGSAWGATAAARGPLLVGERGPELIYAHGGESVVPAPQTSGILSALASAAAAGAGGGGDIVLHLNLQMPPPGEYRAAEQRATLRYGKRNGRTGLSLPYP